MTVQILIFFSTFVFVSIVITIKVLNLEIQIILNSFIQLSGNKSIMSHYVEHQTMSCAVFSLNTTHATGRLHRR